MSVQVQNELRDFHVFVGEQLARNPNGLTPEDALDLWRDQHPFPEDMAESVKAIREALDAMDAGDTGMTVDEFERRFRDKHGLPAKE